MLISNIVLIYQSFHLISFVLFQKQTSFANISIMKGNDRFLDGPSNAKKVFISAHKVQELKLLDYTFKKKVTFLCCKKEFRSNTKSNKLL